MDQCKWDGCEATPRRRSGYCERHYKLARARGLVGWNGDVCCEEACEAPAVVKGRCRTHYKHTLLATRPPCSVDGCDSPVNSLGLCLKHYARLRSKGSTEDGRKNAAKPCTVDGCEARAVTHGLCNRHRKRVARYGSVDLPELPVPVNPSPFVCRWCGIELPKLDRGRQFYCCREHFALWERMNRNTDEAKAKRRDQHLRRAYGISAVEFDAILAAQDGCCAICRGVDSNTARTEGLTVDHCHDSGRVRALLCHDCNTGLGKFGDDPARLEAAAAYLRRHAAVPSPPDNLASPA